MNCLFRNVITIWFLHVLNECRLNIRRKKYFHCKELCQKNKNGGNNVQGILNIAKSPKKNLIANITILPNICINVHINFACNSEKVP